MALKQIETDLRVHGTATVEVLEVISSVDGADGVVLKFPSGTAGDAIEVAFQGNDGTYNVKYASIRGGVEAWSPDDGFLGFRTSDGGILSEKVRVTAAGTLEVGGASVGTSGTLVGGLVVAGASYLNTIAHETTDVDVFLVSNAGLIKYRTGAELRSDIGAGTSSSDTWIPLTGTVSGYVTAQGASNTGVFLNGNGAWSTPTNTTYSQYAGTTAGLVPTGANSTTKYLREDGTWVVPPDTNTQIPALTTEQVQDIAGGMINVTAAQSGMGVTYNDTTGKIDFDLSHTHTDANTQNIFTSSWVDSGTSALLRLTKSGASTGTQDITITPGTGISVTPVGDVLTITNTAPNVAETYTSHESVTQWTVPAPASRQYISDLTLDANGHVTGGSVATETVVNTDTQLTNAQVIAMLLTGFTTFGSASTVVATDSIFTAFRKLEYRVNLNDSKVTNSTQTTINITANNTNNETVYPVFVDGATGTQGLESDTGLYYNPSTGVATAVNWALSSDKRKKKDIEDIQDIKPFDINFRQFRFKKGSTKLRYGVIAQEIEENYPELVDENDKGEKAVSYIDLLVREAAYQRDRADRAEAKLEDLENDIALIKKALNLQ